MAERDELRDYMEGSAYGGGGDSAGGAMGRAQYYDDLAKSRSKVTHSSEDRGVFLVSAICAIWLFLTLLDNGWTDQRAGLVSFLSLFGFGLFFKRTRIGRFLLKAALLVIFVGLAVIVFNLYASA